MLPKRLSEIFQIIPAGTEVADIGSDHGYIPIELGKRGFPTPIATEISSGPYLQCLRNIERSQVQVDLRLGNGLDPICPGEVGMIIIAGMSGQTMKQILKEAGVKIYSFSSYLFQPMIGSHVLREFLFKKGLGITKEWVVEEDRKYYRYMTVITEKIGIPSHLYSAYPNIGVRLLLQIGPHLLLNTDIVVHRYLLSKLHSLQAIEMKLDRNKHRNRHHLLQQEIDQWKQVIACHTKLLKS